MVAEVKLCVYGFPKRKLALLLRKLALAQINQNKRDDEQSHRHSFSRPVPQPPSENDEKSWLSSRYSEILLISGYSLLSKAIKQPYELKTYEST